MAQRRLVIPVASYVDVMAGLRRECSDLPGVEFRGLQVDLREEGPLGAPEGSVQLSEEDQRLLMEAEVVAADTILLSKCLHLLQRAKWVHSFYAGVDAVVSCATSTPSFTLTRQVGNFGQLMGEYVLGQVLARERDLFSVEREMRQHKWRWHCETHRTLPTLTIGVLGVGQIGRRGEGVAELCKGCGMEVWGLTRTTSCTGLACIDHSCQLDDLPKLLAASDYVCNTLPSTPLTRGLLNGDVLQHCATKKSVFINVGRGDIVSEADLIHALNEGWLGGAVLDVFESEPLRVDSLLWDMPNVTLTPHLSGISSTSECVSLFVNNLKRYLSGQPLQHTVDFSRGY